MNSITDTLAAFCARCSTQSYAVVSTIIESPVLKQVLYPAIIFLCVLAFLSVCFILDWYTLDTHGISATSKRLNTVEAEQHEHEIELVDIRAFTHKKRLNCDDQVSDESRIKSPKLMQIKANLAVILNEKRDQQQPRPNQQQPRSKAQSRRASLPKNEFKFIDLNITRNNKVLIIHKDSDRITLVPDDSEAINESRKQQQGQRDEKKPFEWYLRWNLPAEELEKLSYSEKARRFYILTNIDETPFFTDPPPPEVENGHSQDQDNNLDHQQVQVFQPAHIEPYKPINLLSSIIATSNAIDIPKLQMYLLKMNQRLTYSLTKRLEANKFDYSPQSCLRGQIDFSALINPRPSVSLDAQPRNQEYRDHRSEQYQAECERLNTSYRIVNEQKSYGIVDEFTAKCEKIIPGKPLNKAQLHNILFIISQ